MRFVLLLLFLFGIPLAHAACEDGLPAGTRNDVLIIVNDNAVDSCEVGRYYAERRELGAASILHIKAPTSYFVDWNQFKVIREQVFRGLIGKITAADSTFSPASCAPSTSAYCAASVAQVRARTGIKVLVTTWGMPAKVASMPGSDARPASLDDYLRMSMVNYIETGDSFPERYTSSVRRTEIEAGGYRPVEPAVDAELIIGRIDNVTANGAKALVDRAIGAEKSGLFGKAFWDVSNETGGGFDQRFKDWLYQPKTGNNYANESISAGTTNSNAAWRYVFGVFDESRDQCVGYTSPFYLQSGTEAPAECRVKLEVDGHFGLPESRATIVDRSVLYLGNLDGQPTYEPDEEFSTLLNWRKAGAGSGAPALCEMCQDAECKAESTDIFKEIDTRCAGVADGFIGYNYQSWPLAYLASWPTGWYATEVNNKGYSGVSGDHAYLALPEVVADSHDTDGGALHFGHSKNIAAAVDCYTDTGLGAQASCVQRQDLSFGQKIRLDQFYAPGLEYELKFWYKKTAAWNSDNELTISVQMSAKEPTPGAVFKIYNYGAMQTSSGPSLQLPAGACVGNWCQATFNLVLDPGAANVGHTVDASAYTGIRYTRMKIVLETAQAFQGDILFDNFSLVRKLNGVQSDIQLQNASFNDGHSQFSTGDFAASYLGRLNGTAFFGSMAHHKTNGHSFVKSSGDSIMHLLRGMPLGEAVWLGNGGGGSGVLYGDPLFSPVAVSFDRTALAPYHGIEAPIVLAGNVRNGTDPAKTTTSYSVDYCFGEDFMVCDRNNGWVPTSIGGQGNVIPAAGLGSFTLPGNSPEGYLILRLNAIATSVADSTDIRVLHDFQRVKVTHLAGDDDGDGLLGSEELGIGTDPLVWDTDNDTFSDGFEAQHGFNPLGNDIADSDRDGLSDLLETYVGSNLGSIDSDGDGYTDYVEWNTAGNSATTISNGSLHPVYGIAPIPMYARAGREYRVTLNGATAQTMLGALTYAFGGRLDQGVFTWTPTSLFANRVFDVKFGNPNAWYQIKTIALDGDVNEDGVFDLGDLLLLKKIVLGAVQPTQSQIYHADVHPLSEPGGVPDDKLDLSDFIVLEKKLMTQSL